MILQVEKSMRSRALGFKVLGFCCIRLSEDGDFLRITIKLYRLVDAFIGFWLGHYFPEAVAI